MEHTKHIVIEGRTAADAAKIVRTVAGQLGMMISHPSDYNVMLDLQKKATGTDQEKAQTVIDNMRYGLIPTGPDGKRAVVFGGSNIHILKPEYVEGGKVDEPAAKAISAKMKPAVGFTPEKNCLLMTAASEP